MVSSSASRPATRATAWVASDSSRIEVWSTLADPSTPTSSRCRSSISSTRRSCFRDQPAFVARRVGNAPRTCSGEEHRVWRIAVQRAVRTRRDQRCRNRRAPTRRRHGTSASRCSRVKLAGATLSVACTHLQHSGGGAREQLAAVIETLISRPSPRLLLGDFNLGPDDVEPLLATRGFTAAPSGPTFPAGAPRRRIDWIAVDGGLRVVGARRHDPVVGDHCPLSADSRPWSRRPEPTYRFGVPYATRPMHDADSHIMERAGLAASLPRRRDAGPVPVRLERRRRDPGAQAIDEGARPSRRHVGTAPRTNRSSCCARTSRRPVRS